MIGPISLSILQRTHWYSQKALPPTRVNGRPPPKRPPLCHVQLPLAALSLRHDLILLGQRLVELCHEARQLLLQVLQVTPAERAELSRDKLQEMLDHVPPPVAPGSSLSSPGVEEVKVHQTRSISDHL